MKEIEEKDLAITFFKASGPGGQKKNKTASGVRIKHLPTGIIVTATEFRSQTKNKELALIRIGARLASLQRRRKKRIPTRPGKKSRERRLRQKRIRGDIKRGRAKVES